MSNTQTAKNTQRGRPSTKEAVQAKRPPRVSMSGSRLRMNVDKSELDPNFHYAWINDQADLIFRAKRAGYIPVETSEIASWGSRGVDSADSTSSLVEMPVDKKGTMAIFMKQPMEYHEEDLLEQRKLNQSKEADIVKDLNSETDGRYGKVDFD